MFRSLLTSLFLLGLVGCSIQERVSRTSEGIQQRFEEVKDWDALPLREISWEQALAMINQNNLDIRASRTAIDESKREELSVYTDLIPGVSIYGYLSDSIDNLVKASTEDDVKTNINITFNLPTLTQVPYRVYASKARTFAAEKALEGKQREMRVKLYRTLRQRELDLEGRRIDKLSDANYKENSEDREQIRSSDATYWQAIASLLGDHDARWHVRPSTMPRVTWESYRHKVHRLDPLIVCEMALRVEEARLKQFDVALNYLPTINTSLSNPTLFSSTGGAYSGTFLDSGDTMLNLDLSYTLDTKLAYWNNYKSNKENFEKVCQTVLDELGERRVQLESLMRSVEAYEHWHSYMNKRIAFVTSNASASASSFVDKQKEIWQMKRELLSQERRALESEVALATEYDLPKSK